MEKIKGKLFKGGMWYQIEREKPCSVAVGKAPRSRYCHKDCEMVEMGISSNYGKEEEEGQRHPAKPPPLLWYCKTPSETIFFPEPEFGVVDMIFNKPVSKPDKRMRDSTRPGSIMRVRPSIVRTEDRIARRSTAERRSLRRRTT